MKKSILLLLVTLSYFSTTKVFAKKEINWDQNLTKIEYAYQTGDYKKGIKKLNDLIPQISAKLSENSSQMVRAYALLAKHYAGIGKFDAYRSNLENAKNTLAKLDKTNTELYAKALIETAEACIAYSEFVKAEPFIMEAKAMQIGDRYTINRINLAYLTMRLNMGYLNKIQDEFTEPLKVASETALFREPYTDSKGREKLIKYSKEESMLRARICAQMVNLQAQALMGNGELNQADNLLEMNKAWIKKNIRKKEGAYAEALYLQALIALESDNFNDAEKKLNQAETASKGFLKHQSDMYMKIQEALIPTLRLLERHKEASATNNALDAKMLSYYGKNSFAWQRNNLIDTRRYLLNHDWNKAQRDLEKFLSKRDLVPADNMARANALLTLYDVCIRTNQYELAERCLFEADSIKKGKLGENAPAYNMLELKLAEHYVAYGDQFKKAEAIYASSLDKIIRNEISHKNKYFAGYLYSEATMFIVTDRFDKASVLVKEALTDAEKYYNNNSVPYAIALVRHAEVDIPLGKYTDADARLEEAIRIFQDKGTVKDRLEHARALENKARLQILQGLYDEANVTLRRSYRLTRRAEYGDVNVSGTSEEITELNIYLGKYHQTEEALIKLIKSREEKFGLKSSTLIGPLNLYGYLKSINGNYTEAEKSIQRAAAISKELLGEKSGKYAASLRLLERLYASIGDYEKAESTGQKVVDNAKLVYGKDHVILAQSMNELALVKHYNKKNKKDIESLFNESLRIIRESLGETSPPYAEALENMSVFYLETGRLDQASEILDKANAIWVSRLGQENSHTARINYIKGEISNLKKNYAEANNYFLKSKDIFSSVFDASHPEYVQALGKSAQMYYNLNDIKNAVASSEETVEKSLTYLDKIFPTLSEKGKTYYWEKIKNDYEFYKTLAFTQNATYPDMIGKAYNITLKTKAILLSSSIKVRETILKSGDSTLIRNYQEWISRKENLTAVLALSAAQRKENGIDLPKLENEIEEYERKLSEQSDIFAGVYEKTKQPDWTDLKKVLAENEIAIELVPFRLFDKKFTDTIWYAVMAVHSQTKNNPDFVLIKNGSEMDHKFIRYYRNCIKFEIDDNLSYDVFWKPIQELLKKDYAKIYLSPDGAYNQINLESIMAPDNDYLINKYNIILISSTRDLLKRGAEKKDKKKSTPVVVAKRSVKLFGNPVYYPASVAEAKRKTPPLPGAENEVKKLDALLQASNWETEIVTTDLATEDKVKHLTSPSVFHIATHGFFLAEAGNTSELDEVSEKAVQNPLLRSGLLLKNGGYLLESGNIYEFNKEDGILTAYEAMNLGLDNTELVVLSACETGLGEVKLGEGVYGLQRSFLVAGAETIIMSLFKVSDEVTTELMTSFYTKWIQSGDKRKAFIEAKKEIKEKYKSPKFWGAFLMVGIE